MKILIASKNKNKIKEIQDIFAGTGCELLSLQDIDLDIDVEENANSYLFNSLKKATEISKRTNMAVLADDSGLNIDFFDGAPGVQSSRFLGEDTDYAFKNSYILDKMAGVEESKRGASFECVMSLVFPDGTCICTSGVVLGRIADKISGVSGFGYDPIFFLPEFGKTTAEMTDFEKNSVSHRGLALKKLLSILEKLAVQGAC